MKKEKKISFKTKAKIAGGTIAVVGLGTMVGLPTLVGTLATYAGYKLAQVLDKKIKITKRTRRV